MKLGLDLDIHDAGEGSAPAAKCFPIRSTTVGKDWGTTNSTYNQDIDTGPGLGRRRRKRGRRMIECNIAGDIGSLAQCWRLHVLIGCRVAFTIFKLLI